MVQVAVDVISTGAPPEIIALAVNEAVPPLLVAFSLVGLTVMPVTFESATVTVAVPLTVPDAPVMVAGTHRYAGHHTRSA